MATSVKGTGTVHGSGWLLRCCYDDFELGIRVKGLTYYNNESRGVDELNNDNGLVKLSRSLEISLANGTV